MGQYSTSTEILKKLVLFLLLLLFLILFLFVLVPVILLVLCIGAFSGAASNPIPKAQNVGLQRNSPKTLHKMAFGPTSLKHESLEPESMIQGR